MDINAQKKKLLKADNEEKCQCHLVKNHKLFTEEGLSPKRL